jgi:tRNA 2-thiouridine synthesizing protein D
MTLAKEKNVELLWCNCGACVDERGVENQVEGACRGGPVDAWKYCEASQGVLLISTK